MAGHCLYPVLQSVFLRVPAVGARSEPTVRTTLYNLLDTDMITNLFTKTTQFYRGRLMLLALLAAFMAPAFNSCGDDGDGGDTALEGCWKAIVPDSGETEFYLVLNPDGSCSYVKVNASWGGPESFDGYWTSSDIKIYIYPENPSENVDEESWYYRTRNSKIYLYNARSDFDRDEDEDVDYICHRCDPSEIDTPGGGDVADSGIIGTWSMSGTIPGEGYVTSSMTFRADGTCTIKEVFTDYPSDSYSVTVAYSLSGSLSSGATLKMWGKTADGDDYSAGYKATLSGSKLTLRGISGEAAGDTLVLTRQ